MVRREGAMERTCLAKGVSQLGKARALEQAGATEIERSHLPRSGAKRSIARGRCD
jgi:hypothetical protein